MNRLMHYQVDHSTTTYLCYIPKNLDFQTLKEQIVDVIRNKNYTEQDVQRLRNCIVTTESVKDITEYVRQHAETIAEKFIDSLVNASNSILISKIKKPDMFDVFISIDDLSEIIDILDLPIDNFITLYV